MSSKQKLVQLCHNTRWNSVYSFPYLSIFVLLWVLGSLVCPYISFTVPPLSPRRHRLPGPPHGCGSWGRPGCVRQQSHTQLLPRSLRKRKSKSAVAATINEKRRLKFCNAFNCLQHLWKELSLTEHFRPALEFFGIMAIFPMGRLEWGQKCHTRNWN